MKRIIQILVLQFLFVPLFATSIKISFTATGVTSTLDSIKVENVTQGTTITIKGGDDLLLTNVTNVVEIEKTDSISVVPNPITNEGYLHFTVPVSGNTTISILSELGKTVLSQSDYLQQGNYSYVLGGLTNGVYVISVTGTGFSYSTKIISSNNNSGEVYVKQYSVKTISKNGISVPNTNTLKSLKALQTMDYYSGDVLKYTGMSGSISSIIKDVPTTSKTISFDFSSNLLPTITNFKMTEANSNNQNDSRPHSAAGPKMSLPFYSQITNDSILFNNINLHYSNYFFSCLFSVKSSNNDSIFINDTLLIIGYEKVHPLDINGNPMYSNYVFDGTKVKIYSKDGKYSKTYILGIKYGGMQNDTASYAVVSEQLGDSFTFLSDKFKPMDSIFQLPPLPKGTLHFTISITSQLDPFSTSPVINLKLTDLPHSFFITAPDKKTKKTYTIVKSTLPDADALIDSVYLRTDSTYNVTKTVSGFTITSDTMTLKKAYIGFKTKQFAKVFVVDSITGSNGNQILPYYGIKFNIYNKSVFYRVINNKDTTNVIIKGVKR